MLMCMSAEFSTTEYGYESNINPRVCVFIISLNSYEPGGHTKDVLSQAPQLLRVALQVCPLEIIPRTVVGQ